MLLLLPVLVNPLQHYSLQSFVTNWAVKTIPYLFGSDMTRDISAAYFGAYRFILYVPFL